VKTSDIYWGAIPWVVLQLILVLALIFPSHIDELFNYARQQIDQHRNGSDPAILLRSARFANYHDDPRYRRLLAKLGFDASGNPQ